MEIKLYNDVVFKWVFGRQEQTYPLICFLNAVVSYDADDRAENVKTKFSEVEILNPYDVNEPFTSEKQGILDIRAKDINSQEWIDLEVQVIRKADYKERSKYYLAGMYRDQLKKNSEHNYDELRACYGIHLLVDSIFEEKDEQEFWFNHYRMLNIRTYKTLDVLQNLIKLAYRSFISMFKFLVIDFWARSQQEQYLCERAGVDSNLPINLPLICFRDGIRRKTSFIIRPISLSFSPGSRSCSKDLIHSIKTSI